MLSIVNLRLYFEQKEEKMAQAKEGHTVRIHYKGTFEDGSVFESSDEGEPLEFTIGEQVVIPGLEKAVIGMNEGETKAVTVPPDEAYGPYRSIQVIPLKRSQLPPDINPEVGKTIQLRDTDGAIQNAFFKEVTEETVVVDTNHPLAGKTLNFEIKLLEIV
jgi:FKBP-type peptidyl-prolyl cis-trans isomerase 2